MNTSDPTTVLKYLSTIQFATPVESLANAVEHVREGATGVQVDKATLDKLMVAAHEVHERHQQLAKGTQRSPYNLYGGDIELFLRKAADILGFDAAKMVGGVRMALADSTPGAGMGVATKDVSHFDAKSVDAMAAALPKLEQQIREVLGQDAEHFLGVAPFVTNPGGKLGICADLAPVAHDNNDVFVNRFWKPIHPFLAKPAAGGAVTSLDDRDWPLEPLILSGKDLNDAKDLASQLAGYLAGDERVVSIKPAILVGNGYSRFGVDVTLGVEPGSVPKQWHLERQDIRELVENAGVGRPVRLSQDNPNNFVRPND